MIKSTLNENILIIKVDESITYLNCIDLQQELDDITKTHNEKFLIFDFSNVKFINSSGLGVIIKIYKTKKFKKIFAINVNANIEKIFIVTNINKIVCIKKSLEYVVKELES